MTTRVRRRRTRDRRAWNLATTITRRQAEGNLGTSIASEVELQDEVQTQQQLGFDPIDGASNTGASSGWALGSPTRSPTANGD